MQMFSKFNLFFGGTAAANSPPAVYACSHIPPSVRPAGVAEGLADGWGLGAVLLPPGAVHGVSNEPAAAYAAGGGDSDGRPALGRWPKVRPDHSVYQPMGTRCWHHP